MCINYFHHHKSFYHSYVLYVIVYVSSYIVLLLVLIVNFGTRPSGYKTFFILNSVENEILNAHKYKNIKKFGFFKAQISLECYFSRS